MPYGPLQEITNEVTQLAEGYGKCRTRALPVAPSLNTSWIMQAPMCSQPSGGTLRLRCMIHSLLDTSWVRVVLFTLSLIVLFLCVCV